MSKKKKGGRYLLVALFVVVAGVAWAWQTGRIFSPDEGPAIEGAPVRKGRLEITVSERGNLTAKNSVSMKNEMEGRSTILYLIPEGTRVEAGDVVAELDSSDLVDRKVAQEISVQSARAAETKAREGLEIQRIENDSLIARAEQDLSFAHSDLDKFLGEDPPLSADLIAEIRAILRESQQSAEVPVREPMPAETTAPGEPALDEEVVADEQAGATEETDPAAAGDESAKGTIFEAGDREQQFLQAQEDIQVAQEEQARAKQTLEWSSELFKKGFIAQTELEADQLTLQRATIRLDQARRALYLLGVYEHPKELAKLEGAVEEAERQLQKAEKQAIAQLADHEANLNSSVVKRELEEQKLVKLEEQISKSTLRAPVAGMIVYGRTEGGHRWGGGEPVQEGGEVRERQEIASIPGSGGMVAQASIHESVLKQVVPGLPVIVTVDALPGHAYTGKVNFVSQLPDPNSWFANPNQRLYRTEILIEDADAEMRPGMSCNIEVLVETLEDTLYVPLQAVFFTGGRNLVWVRKDGKVEERTVEIGAHNEKWVQVTSGVAEGEVVLLSPPPGFQPQEASPDEAAETDQEKWNLPEGFEMPERGGSDADPGAALPGASGRRGGMGGDRSDAGGDPSGMTGDRSGAGGDRSGFGGDRSGTGRRRMGQGGSGSPGGEGMRPDGGSARSRGSRQRPGGEGAPGEGGAPGGGERGGSRGDSGGDQER